MDKNKILKMIVILAAIVVIASSISRLIKRNSMTLSDYAALHPSTSEASTESDAELSSGGLSSGELSPETTARPDSSPAPNASRQPDAETQEPSSGTSDVEKEEISSSLPDTQKPETSSGTPNAEMWNTETLSQPVGASLNGTSQLEERWTLEDGFYYEPLSEHLQRYITGISYPASEADSKEPEISLQELRYVHILHYDFDGNSTEGELICNEYIAQDLVEIFCELYRNEYRIEKVRLIDEYSGDDHASMEDNNTSCFNYRLVAGSNHLSKHALGLALDINPLYNPYVAYDTQGGKIISPANASPYADRTADFPYKIDENDLCYKLFIEHGFIWGGNWNNMKDYQHFQKTK